MLAPTLAWKCKYRYTSVFTLWMPSPNCNKYFHSYCCCSLGNFVSVMPPSSTFSSVLLCSACCWCLWLGLTGHQSMVAVWLCLPSSITSLLLHSCGWEQRPFSCSRSWSSSLHRSLSNTSLQSPLSAGVSYLHHIWIYNVFLIIMWRVNIY